MTAFLMTLLARWAKTQINIASHQTNNFLTFQWFILERHIYASYWLKLYLSDQSIFQRLNKLANISQSHSTTLYTSCIKVVPNTTGR